MGREQQCSSFFDVDSRAWAGLQVSPANEGISTVLRIVHFLLPGWVMPIVNRCFVLFELLSNVSDVLSVFIVAVAVLVVT